MPLGSLGAIEANGVVSFGLWLPWVSATHSNVVTVKIIHEADQFLQEMPPREFRLAHSFRPPYGDFWSFTVAIAGTAPAQPGSAWGKPGRYLYRYTITRPNAGTLDWIIDPFAREFGAGKLSAFTLGYTPYVWSSAEERWRTPALADLVLYEMNIAEFGSDLEPLVPGEFRLGDTRHTISDNSRMNALGWRPSVPVEQNVREYVAWMREQKDTAEYLEEAERVMREQGVVRSVAGAPAGA